MLKAVLVRMEDQRRREEDEEEEAPKPERVSGFVICCPSDPKYKGMAVYYGGILVVGNAERFHWVNDRKDAVFYATDHDAEVEIRKKGIKAPPAKLDPRPVRFDKYLTLDDEEETDE